MTEINSLQLRSCWKEIVGDDHTAGHLWWTQCRKLFEDQIGCVSWFEIDFLGFWQLTCFAARLDASFLTVSIDILLGRWESRAAW